MQAPLGWKLVPINPTPAMLSAYKRAISAHIEGLPPEERAKAKAQKRGYRVKAKVKLRLRWLAMVYAAPECNELPSEGNK